MAKRPKLSKSMQEQLTKLDSSDMKAIARLPVIETDDPEFGQLFLKNPGAALAAKGLELDPKEVIRVQERINELSQGHAAGMDKADVEVGVSIKVKF